MCKYVLLLLWPLLGIGKAVCGGVRCGPLKIDLSSPRRGKINNNNNNNKRKITRKKSILEGISKFSVMNAQIKTIRTTMTTMAI